MNDIPKLHNDLSLQYLVRTAQDGTPKPPLLIMLHGFGSNEGDLFALARSIPPEFIVLSVRGPITLGEGQYAWYPLDWSTGSPVSEQKETERARQVILDFIEEVIAHFPVDQSHIYLLGFSQGAIMSASIAFHAPKLLAGVMAFSGRILPETRSSSTSLIDLKGFKMFWGHGTEDQVLSIEHGREAQKFLSTLDVSLEYHEYSMGHGIIKEEWEDAKKWLREAMR